MVNLKMNLFNNIISKDYVNDFNNQIKCVKDSVLTLEEAIKLLERECIPEMEDKCKIVKELVLEGIKYQDKIKKTLDKEPTLGPNSAKYGYISDIMGGIGQKAKSVSELLTSIKDEELSKDLTKDFVKLIEIDESISREIYLIMKKIEDIEDEKINRFSKKIIKKKVEVEELSKIMLDKCDKKNKTDKECRSFESIVEVLKKIPEDAEKVALIINQ